MQNARARALSSLRPSATCAEGGGGALRSPPARSPPPLPAAIAARHRPQAGGNFNSPRWSGGGGALQRGGRARAGPFCEVGGGGGAEPPGVGGRRRARAAAVREPFPAAGRDGRKGSRGAGTDRQRLRLLSAAAAGPRRPKGDRRLSRSLQVPLGGTGLSRRRLWRSQAVRRWMATTATSPAARVGRAAPGISRTCGRIALL